MQFAHARKILKDCSFEIEGTIALKVPPKDLLHKMFIEHANQTVVFLGLSVVSNKDKFIKKTGRELASKRLTTAIVNLDSIYNEGTKHVYNFRSEPVVLGLKKYTVKFELTSIAENSEVRLIRGSLYEI